MNLIFNLNSWWLSSNQLGPRANKQYIVLRCNQELILAAGAGSDYVIIRVWWVFSPPSQHRLIIIDITSGGLRTIIIASHFHQGRQGTNQGVNWFMIQRKATKIRAELAPFTPTSKCNNKMLNFRTSFSASLVWLSSRDGSPWNPWPGVLPFHSLALYNNLYRPNNRNAALAPLL